MICLGVFIPSCPRLLPPSEPAIDRAMIDMRVLGTVEIHGPNADAPMLGLTQPRQLALLLYLAFSAARTPVQGQLDGFPVAGGGRGVGSALAPQYAVQPAPGVGRSGIRRAARDTSGSSRERSAAMRWR